MCQPGGNRVDHHEGPGLSELAPGGRRPLGCVTTSASGPASQSSFFPPGHRRALITCHRGPALGRYPPILSPESSRGLWPPGGIVSAGPPPTGWARRDHAPSCPYPLHRIPGFWPQQSCWCSPLLSGSATNVADHGRAPLWKNPLQNLQIIIGPAIVLGSRQGPTSRRMSRIRVSPESSASTYANGADRAAQSPRVAMERAVVLRQRHCPNARLLPVVIQSGRRNLPGAASALVLRRLGGRWEQALSGCQGHRVRRTPKLSVKKRPEHC